MSPVAKNEFDKDDKGDGENEVGEMVLFIVCKCILKGSRKKRIFCGQADRKG